MCLGSGSLCLLGVDDIWRFFQQMGRGKRLRLQPWLRRSMEGASSFRCAYYSKEIR